MQITVFTPTYNRAHLLPRLYESLCRQTFRDFEWIIVDDGSVDDTKDVIDKLIIENGELKINQQFPIRYFYQKNGGKHRAINHGIKKAQGELFFIADSDDMLVANALHIVIDVYEGIKENKEFAGVCGLDGTPDGVVIGNGLPDEMLDDTSISIRYKQGIKGDMKEVFRTDVLKKYPFPEINGERFCPEVLVWNRIAEKYKLRHFNQIIYLADYQVNGISAGILKARMNSPIASMMTYQELTLYTNVPFLQKCKAAINFFRFYMCSNNTSERPKLKMRWWLFSPLGYLRHLHDKNVIK